MMTAMSRLAMQQNISRIHIFLVFFIHDAPLMVIINRNNVMRMNVGVSINMDVNLKNRV
uniref:Uncharacterized protein n=1 Tax=Ascaris lumbricoides TaxID=6252 RepID=A0A0M3IX81_ASCLU